MASDDDNNNNNNKIVTKQSDKKINKFVKKNITIKDSFTQVEIKDIYNNNYPKNVFFKNIISRKKYIIESFRMNYIIWITFSISIILLSININDSILKNIINVIGGFNIFILLLIHGWLIHYLSHYSNFREIYSLFFKNISDIEVKNNVFHRCILKILEYSSDYHDIHHHNSEYNKELKHLILEFIGNLWTQGGYLILFIYIFSMNFNYKIIFLWIIMYSTVHIINYNIIEPIHHIEHHDNFFTNYGIDIIDIFMGTKYKLESYNDIENINHYSINCILITMCIIYFNYK